VDRIVDRTGATFLPPCFRLLGVRGVAAREGAMTLGMAASGWLCNGFGVVYPGAVVYLADAAITLAAGTTVPAATAFSTIDLKLYLLRPVLPADGELIAHATVAHRGEHTLKGIAGPWRLYSVRAASADQETTTFRSRGP
jgi:uncharacterized protein (TIGR00369 family)